MSKFKSPILALLIALLCCGLAIITRAEFLIGSGLGFLVIAFIEFYTIRQEDK